MKTFKELTQTTQVTEEMAIDKMSDNQVKHHRSVQQQNFRQLEERFDDRFQELDRFLQELVKEGSIANKDAAGVDKEIKMARKSLTNAGKFIKKVIK